MFPNRPPAPRRPGRPLALAVVLAVAAARGHAADPPPAAAADANLARAALGVLDADPLLRDFNLVVSVVDRVAVVGGPVASAELKDRAGELVRRVPGVRAVQNGCYLQTGPEPLLRPYAAATRSPPTLPPVVLPPRPATAEATPPPGDLFAAAPVPVPAAAGEVRVEVRRPANPLENVLLPPVASGSPATPRDTSFRVVPPAVLTGRAAFADAIDAVRRSDPRFAGLRAEPRDGAEVVITGTVAQHADAWALAERLQSVPGVLRVVVGPVARRG